MSNIVQLPNGSEWDNDLPYEAQNSNAKVWADHAWENGQRDLYNLKSAPRPFVVRKIHEGYSINIPMMHSHDFLIQQI